MKLTFTEDKLAIILEHFKDKTPKNQEYIAAAKELEEAAAAEQPEAQGTQDSW
jgi:hypothetical protein